MAGIGFKLRRMVEEGTFAGFIQGYVYSAIIAAGPWIISIATLASLAYLTGGTTPRFATTVVYVYSFSLIFVGMFQFTVTRYISDRLWAGDTAAQIPAFFTTWCMAVAPQVAAFYVLLWFLEASPAFRLHAAGLYGIVATIWVTLVFLGVVRAYRVVILSFLVGAVVSVALAAVLGRWLASPGGGASEVGMLAGYAAGQTVTLLVLLWVLFSEFRFDHIWDSEVGRYLWRYAWLSASGLVYYAGMWVDKFIFRFSSRGEMVTPHVLYAAQQYEMADFLAQLTVIPALAVFFLRVETDFFERFREFYARIQLKASLSQIEEARELMEREVRMGGARLLVVQTFITVLAILLAPSLFFHLQLDDVTIRLARIQMVAVLFQTLMFCVAVVMMYYEAYREACLVFVAFLAANGLFTFGLLPLGEAYDGFGFLAAALMSFLSGVVLLFRRLRHIQYITFVHQPISNLVALPPERLTDGRPGEYTFVREGS